MGKHSCFQTNQYCNVILSSLCSHFSGFFLYRNRGDPTLVKINVSITTGYLISGETYGKLETCILEAKESLHLDFFFLKILVPKHPVSIVNMLAQKPSSLNITVQ